MGYYSQIAFDLEWSKRGIDVVGMAWEQDGRLKCCAAPAHRIPELVNKLNQADQIIGHNILDADIPKLREAGYTIDTRNVFDTRLALHCTHGHLAGTGSYDLRGMVLLLGELRGGFRLDFKDYMGDLYRTCGFDAAASYWAGNRLLQGIQRGKLESTLQIAHQCQPIFTAMHQQGVRLDTKVLEQIHTVRQAHVEETVEKYQLYEIRGKKVQRKVPIWRSVRLLDIYEQRFGIRPRDNQRGTWRELVHMAPSASARAVAEAVVSLSEGSNDAHWLGHVDEGVEGLSYGKVSSDGFIYPRYDLCGSPDRAVASSPNIQNFPRPADDPRPVKLRSAVVPLDPGHCLLGADFSAIETITNAYESHDMDRVRAVLDKRVSHEGTAEMVNRKFNLSLSRQSGKAINHAFDKGESPFNLAGRLFGGARPNQKQIAQCCEIYEVMLATYPATARFRDELWDRATTNPLVVVNAFGRQLKCFSRSRYGDNDATNYAKHDPKKKYWCSCSACGPRRDRWKYAIAFLGRSCAFDALLRAMAKIHATQRLDGYSLPYLEVHDELDFSVPRDKVEHYAILAKEAMEEPIPELDGISLPAECKWGDNWADAH